MKNLIENKKNGNFLKLILFIPVIVLGILAFSNNAQASENELTEAQDVKTYKHYKNRGLFGGVNNCKKKPGVCVVEMY